MTRLGLRLFSLLLAAQALSACPARSPATLGDGDGVGDDSCRVRFSDPAPDLSPPPPFSPPPSRLGVDVRANLTALSRELSREIPVQLAAAKRTPVGAPGEVSYSVRRGGVSLKLDGDRLVVAVPVRVDVEVCKPFGPFCPTYGSCSPRLAAVASVSTLLGENYEVAPSRVGISVLDTCSIAGIDATPQIRHYASREVGNVQRRIDQSMPAIRPSVAGVWELLHHPISLGGTTCLRIAPERLLQARPTVESGVLTARLAALGELSVEEPCAAPNAAVKPPPLPRLATEAKLPEGVELNVPIRMGWEETSTALTRSLSNSSEPSLRILRVEAHPVLRAGKPRMALHTTLAGRACGDAWLVAEPWYDAATSRVRLRNVTPASPAADSAESHALVQRITESAAIALPVDVSAAPNALESMVLGLGRSLPKGVLAEADLADATFERVALDEQGLVAVPTINGRAAISVQ